MMFSSFFKKDKPSPAQMEELKDANVALRVRVDKILYLSTVKNVVPSKPVRPIFEGRAAA
jgi:hypothetical protein